MSLQPHVTHSVLYNSGSLVIMWFGLFFTEVSLSSPLLSGFLRKKMFCSPCFVLKSQLHKTNNSDKGPGMQPHLRVSKEKVSPRTMECGRRAERKLGCPFHKYVSGVSTVSGSDTKSLLRGLPLHSPTCGTCLIPESLASISLLASL